MSKEAEVGKGGAKLVPAHFKVLSVLAIRAGWDENCLTFAGLIFETGLDRRRVRLACRALARKGLAEFVRGLSDCNGQFAGAGYCATPLGAQLIHQAEGAQ